MDVTDPSVCRLHPGVAVTGFCPACLRDRLAGLQPPSSADLRRCKSFSYARSAAAMEPQRRSCDLFRHQQPIPIVAAVPEELDYYPYQDEAAARPHEQDASSSSSSRKSLGGLLGRKLQQWRRKSKKEPEMPGRQRHRPSCDADPRSGPVPALARLPATLLSLSVEEDDDMAPPPVPRSDGQIPVEEDYYYGDGYGNAAAAPGGTAQTRDYYLDSSSSSRRRRSVDRSATSGRNSFSDAYNGGDLPASRATAATNANGGNARVSPAIAAEQLYHHHHYHHEAQSVLVHHQYCRDDDFSGSFGSARHPRQNPASKQPPNKKGIRGWSIWGLLVHKKSSRKQQQQQQPEGPFFSSEAAAAGVGEYPWPELRARGYNGQMLRCNSSMSARSSFSGGAAAMVGGSGRRSISGVDMRDVVRDGERRTRRDEVLLERTRSSSSYSRSGRGLDPNIPRRSSSKHELSSMHRRSTLGL